MAIGVLPMDADAITTSELRGAEAMYDYLGDPCYLQRNPGRAVYRATELLRFLAFIQRADAQHQALRAFGCPKVAR